MSTGFAWKSWSLPVQGTSLRVWQAGRCAMCGYDDSRLVRDHCHETGFIRGLVCSGCNTGEDMQDADWAQWREGDTPARALGVVEVYKSPFGTTLSTRSPLQYYTHAEREAWWAGCVDRGELPAVAPWTDVALERKDIEDAETLAALSRMDDWLSTRAAS